MSAGGRLVRTTLLLVLGLLTQALTARAELTLLRTPDGTEIYTSGRIGVFVEVLKGDGQPQEYAQSLDPNTGMPIIDPATGKPALVPVHQIGNGGIIVQGDPTEAPPESCGGKPPCYRQGPVLASRVRSGFLGNVLSLGVRKALTDQIKVSGQVSLWGTTETDSRRTYFKNQTDWREAFIKVEAPFGTLQAGRALSLFSRGAIEINFLYGHQFGVGNPAGFDEYGPSAGHIGYGVVAPVFVAGVSYATPKLAGFQLTAGYFDPATLVGLYWTRTKFGRPEGELTYDAALGTIGKLHLFANGAWQKLYATDVPRSTDVYGTGGGGRIEVGPVHLGIAGHMGQGLGIGYFLDGSDAVVAQYTTQKLRRFSGYYAQAQVVAGDFDFNLGWGMTRVYSLDEDVNPNWCAGSATPCAGFDAAGYPQRSFLKSQTGYSGVVVYHYAKSLHFAFDYFLSKVDWQQGEEQTMHAFNVGSTLTW